MPPQHQDNTSTINHPTDHSSAVIKGKRTKRPRSNSPSSNAPPLLNMPDDYNYNCCSGDEVNQEEDQDMANCLIMLARGNGNRFDSQLAIPSNATGGGHSRKLSQINTNKAGFFVYDCKTCNRSFPSFQALGGHRASHKKPKTNVVPVRSDGEEPTEYKIASAPTPTTLDLRITTLNNKGKIHECSICGSEFSSGQALGGHMRRHRAAMMANQTTDVDIKHRNNVLSLDLNLPAPEDDHHLHTSPKFQFGGSPASTALVFSTPALVDCHY